jgi:hypothetical protein
MVWAHGYADSAEHLFVSRHMIRRMIILRSFDA